MAFTAPNRRRREIKSRAGDLHSQPLAPEEHDDTVANSGSNALDINDDGPDVPEFLKWRQSY